MITPSDIIIVKNSDSWVLRGLDYAEKSFYVTFNRMGKGPYDRIRNIIKGLIPQLAFEHLLHKHKIKYDKLGQTVWYKIDRYDIRLKKRRVDIKANFIGIDTPLSPKNKTWLLDCSALVPTDQLNSRTLRDKDIYIFPFIQGRTNNLLGYNPKERLVRKKEEGKYIIHCFWDYSWWKPKKWIVNHGKTGLGRIKIQSISKKDSGKPFKLIGTSDVRKFQFEKVKLDKNGLAI